MTKNNFAHSQNHSLAWLHVCLIGRLLHDAEALKVHPQGMSWVRQTPTSESISREKMAPFVMRNGLGHGLNRQQGEAKREGKETNGQYRGDTSPSKAREMLLQLRERTSRQARERKCANYRECYENKF